MQLQEATGTGSRIDLGLALPSSATPDGVGELALAATLFAPDEIADDITLFVLAGSYHCHDFQGGRTALWDRLGGWANGVAGSRPSAGTS